MEIANVWGIVVGLIGIAVGVMAFLRPKPGPVNGYGQHLEQQIEKLELTNRSLLRDLQHNQDEIARVTGELSDAQARIDYLETKLATSTPILFEQPPLLAIAGEDENLRIDLAALRGLKSIRLTTIIPASMSAIKRILNGYRGRGVPVRYVHFSVHGSETGLVMKEGVADGNWLSENLQGVEIAVLAGCETERLCEFMAVVPHVISMRSALGHSDAALFTRVFWTAIIEGGSTFRAAMDLCYQRCPSAVMEQVQEC